jgi:hypothetical protein
VVRTGGSSFHHGDRLSLVFALLFARPWMILMGYDPDDKSKLDEMRKGAAKNYAIAFIASLISALVLGKLIEFRPRSPLHGTCIAFAVWLGFVSTMQLTDALFSKKPFKLYAINTGYQLVCYLMMGTILAAWAS